MILYLLVFATLLFLLYMAGRLIQWLGSKESPRFWVIVPAQTGALIVAADRKDGKTTKGGGAVIDVAHSFPGKYFDRSNSDPMKWEVKDLPPGVQMDPRHDNFIHRILRAQFMGIYPTIRTNSDDHMRYGYKGGGDGGVIKENSDKLPKFVHYSGDTTIKLKDLETLDQLQLSFDINLIFERVFFVRSILRVSNPIAYLESMINGILNRIVGQHNAADYRGGADSDDLKKALEDAIMDPMFLRKVLDELGIKITSAEVLSPTMSEGQQKILEMQVEAEAKAKVRVTNAQAELEENLRKNKAARDLFKKVTAPQLKLENEPRNNLATAIKETQLDSLVLGGDVSNLVGTGK